ncbi:BSD domain-containing protein 1 [Pyrus x bretschneideri]|uniref:BSD domain-containing protein 1 n=1 Tax=Pyrus x bretschneideri TaxID=225117 RepID=UPI00202F9D1A|nr:BSD domain-containing protein 1 [Pyrus x bretschneideri]
MNFFKSVFSDDPDPPNPEPESESETGSPNNPEQEHPDPKSPPTQPNPNPTGNTGAWMFGDLIKTLSTRSESVIETYRRDLQEFGLGLKKEIEVAQGSLETVGHVIDEFGNTVLQGTAQILAGDESDSSDAKDQSFSSQQSMNSKRYSRFDAQVRAIQGDASTYCEEPEDLDDYGKWQSGFDLEEKGEEIERLVEENGAVEGIYKSVVPNSVDHESFWCRYFYRVYKLRQAEDVRVNLVKRAISIEEDEELSWDVDDDEYDDNVNNVVLKVNPVKSTEVAAESSGKDGKVEDLKVGNEVGEKSSNNMGEGSCVVEEANVVSKKDDLAANSELVSKGSEQKVVQEESSSVGESQIVEKKGNDVELSGDKGSEKKMQVEGDSGKKDLPSKLEEKGAVEGKKNVAAGKGRVVEEANVVSKKDDLAPNSELVSKVSEQKVVKEESSSVGESQIVEKKGKDVELSGGKESEKKMQVERDSTKKDVPSKLEGKAVVEGKKNGVAESGKGNDVPAVSIKSSTPEEEDLGWDEIEDLSSIDDKEVGHGGGSGSPTNKAELRKRLSTAAAEEEEDLSWDIEDDDDVTAQA